MGELNELNRQFSNLSLNDGMRLIAILTSLSSIFYKFCAKISSSVSDRHPFTSRLPNIYKKN